MTDRFRVLSTKELSREFIVREWGECPCEKHGGTFPYCQWPDSGWHVVEFVDGAATRLIGSDGGEPEDQILVRDWSWVAPALNAAFAAGYDAALRGEEKP